MGDHRWLVGNVTRFDQLMSGKLCFTELQAAEVSRLVKVLLEAGKLTVVRTAAREMQV
jgi:hypothetical protein